MEISVVLAANVLNATFSMFSVSLHNEVMNKSIRQYNTLLKYFHSTKAKKNNSAIKTDKEILKNPKIKSILKH